MAVGVERGRRQFPAELQIGKCRIDQQLTGPHETELQEDRALPSILEEFGRVPNVGPSAKSFVTPPWPVGFEATAITSSPPPRCPAKEPRCIQNGALVMRQK